jgi:hypothetical protein
MKRDWLVGFEGEDKEKWSTYLKASSRVFDKLDDILDSRLEKELTAACGQDDFVGDWANKQAYLMGKINAYRNIKDLIKELTND